MTPHGGPRRNERALLLAGPIAVAGVIAVAWSGADLGTAPEPAVASASDHSTHAADLLTPGSVVVRVRVSASLEEMAGGRTLTVTLPEGATVGTLLNRLGEAHPALAMMGPAVMVAVNGEMQWPGRMLASGEVVDVVSQMAGG